MIKKHLVCSWLLMMCFISFVQASEQKGLEIALEADKRDTGFGNSKATMTMILKNKQGQESVRELRVRTLEVNNDGDKSLIVFDSPFDVRGTALLTYSHKKGSDDQWLYLPAMKRVKRISSSNQSGPFMGSEFAYEDFTSQEVEKYGYNYIKDESLNGQKCFVIERFPKDRNSGYKRQIVWLDQSEYRIQKVEYYDRKNSHLKTLTMDDYKRYLNRFWRPHTMTMINHQTGKSTVLKWDNFEFKTGLNANDFTKASLKRIR